MSAPPTSRTEGVDEGPAGSTRPTAVRAALLSAALFCLVAAFHAALALGAPWGEVTQGGGTRGSLEPAGRIVAVASSGFSLVMAAAILARVGRGPFRHFSHRVRTVLAWSTMVFAVLAVVLNLITPSASERNLWAPVSLLLLVLVNVVMVTTHRMGPGTDG